MSDDNVQIHGGTGEASATAAGAALLVKQARPEATADEIREALKDTADSAMEAGPDVPVIDAEEAVRDV